MYIHICRYIAWFQYRKEKNSINNQARDWNDKQVKLDEFYDSLLFLQLIWKKGMCYASYVISQNRKPIQQKKKSSCQYIAFPMLLMNSNYEIISPLQPSFYPQEDLGTSNRDALSLDCSCANSSFLEPEYSKVTGYINWAQLSQQ